MVGFQADPSEEHIARSSAAIAAVATAATMRVFAGEARLLRICFCHVLLAPRLPFNLYGFNVVTTDDAGTIRDSLAEDLELRYALVVNQPVAVQTEAAMRFLFDLIGRQGPLADVANGNAEFGDLPSLVANADMAASETAWDSLRFSGSHAAEALTARAAGAGYRLEVRYELDALPTRATVIARMPALRRLYNERAEVRDAVDRSVTRFLGRGGEIRGGTEAIRSQIQRHTALTGVRQFLNQALRDADVCGNGFVEFGLVGLDPQLRCLRAEAVEIIDHGCFRLHGPEAVTDLENHVLHLKGLEQIGTPYGISPWEPLLYIVQWQETLNGARRFVEQAPAHRLTSQQAQQLSEVKQVVETVDSQIAKALETFLWFPRKGLDPAVGDLYFSGSERM